MPGGQFAEYGFEYVPGISDESHITWTSGGEPSWRLNNAALDPDPIAEIGRRPVSNEPMYLILNLGLSQSFGTPDFDRLTWPTTMSIGELLTSIDSRPKRLLTLTSHFFSSLNRLGQGISA